MPTEAQELFRKQSRKIVRGHISKIVSLDMTGLAYLCIQRSECLYRIKPVNILAWQGGGAHTSAAMDSGWLQESESEFPLRAWLLVD